MSRVVHIIKTGCYTSSIFQSTGKIKKKPARKMLKKGAGYGIIWISNRGRASKAVSNPPVKRR